jgi:hypothetical protein
MVYKMLQARPILSGGEFVVDAVGFIRLAYCSQDPTDRPAMETLLAALT